MPRRLRRNSQYGGQYGGRIPPRNSRGRRQQIQRGRDLEAARNPTLADLTPYETGRLLYNLNRVRRHLNREEERNAARVERRAERRAARAENAAAALLHNQVYSELENPVFNSPVSIMDLRDSPTSVIQAEEDRDTNVTLEFNEETEESDESYESDFSDEFYEEVHNLLPRPLR